MAAGRSMSNARMPARAAEGAGDDPRPNMGGVSLQPVVDCADVKRGQCGERSVAGDYVRLLAGDEKQKHDGRQDGG
jgi:hypothetical protein